MNEEIHPFFHYLGETPQLVSNVVLPCPIGLSTLTPSQLPALYNSTHVPKDSFILKMATVDLWGLPKHWEMLFSLCGLIPKGDLMQLSISL
jgi:hypothetical protein